MSRVKIITAANADLPVGLYPSGARFRARESCAHPWRYFAGPRNVAIRAFNEWRFPNEVGRFLGPDRAAQLLRGVKKNAKSRNLSVELTIDDIVEMLERANGRCEFCGVEFSSAQYEDFRMKPWIPTIDRINSRLGYTAANCRVICAYANMALNQYGDEFFYRAATALMLKMTTEIPKGQKHASNQISGFKNVKPISLNKGREEPHLRVVRPALDQAVLHD